MLTIKEKRSFTHEYVCSCGRKVTLCTDMKVKDKYTCQKCKGELIKADNLCVAG
jgi:predicted SprT family Zn-dependent metalloprotease